MKNCWIRKRSEYKFIYREGIKKVGRRLILFIHGGGEETRFGITVTKRIGKAVVRNTIKRRLREVIRKNIQSWNSGFDAVIIARNGIVDSSFQEIEKELVEMVEGMIKGSPLPPLRGRSN